MSNLDPVRIARGAASDGCVCLTRWQSVGYYAPGVAFCFLGGILLGSYIANRISEGNSSLLLFAVAGAVMICLGVDSVIRRRQQLAFTVKESGMEWEHVRQALYGCLADVKLKGLNEEKNVFIAHTFRSRGSEGEIIIVVRDKRKVYIGSIYNPADSHRISMGGHNERNIELVTRALAEAEGGSGTDS